MISHLTQAGVNVLMGFCGLVVTNLTGCEQHDARLPLAVGHEVDFCCPSTFVATKSMNAAPFSAAGTTEILDKDTVDHQPIRLPLRLIQCREDLLPDIALCPSVSIASKINFLIYSMNIKD
ncbi:MULTISPECIES: hypothetical protein [Nitrosomonas]|uniref:Uncharacterized protein n=1 Tax=Nitrosomonas communis TaxID=44574 RepID=A0A0F7KB23_9PROT|nr:MULTISPECIES: hypothetical protein [Nitrosomonas]AKH37575.1 hypothetical protein AAW31_06715 [Nitrosomonas communis]TYP80285.1 hypothetical protein BCL69_106112 [Nitrosomonas communis]UVS62843.1 hypothetical protein NX761_06990 [Nitrosomonas sp. PLL12]